MEKAKDINEMLDLCPKNVIIRDNVIKAWHKINSSKYKKIVCTISGGSDSDIMLDLVWRCDINNKVDYVWFDTGLEYQATKDHLKYLEEKYGITITVYKAIKAIPLSCKEYGQPFIAKKTSDYIHRLQRHGFTWEDKSFEELVQTYPNCRSALMWWCNTNQSDQFNIRRNKGLKEFMVENPPDFLISDKCCLYAKKNVLHKLLSEHDYDLNIYGVRKAEGGIRAAAYKGCFTESDHCDSYRPLFWFTDADKKTYEDAFGVTHSECYRTYGLRRTGCAGCPFGRKFEAELQIIQTYEPKLYAAVNHIFGKSYAYTRKYRKYCEEKYGNKRKK